MSHLFISIFILCLEGFWELLLPFHHISLPASSSYVGCPRIPLVHFVTIRGSFSWGHGFRWTIWLKVLKQSTVISISTLLSILKKKKIEILSILLLLERPIIPFLLCKMSMSSPRVQTYSLGEAGTGTVCMKINLLRVENTDWTARPTVCTIQACLSPWYGRNIAFYPHVHTLCLCKFLQCWYSCSKPDWDPLSCFRQSAERYSDGCAFWSSVLFLKYLFLPPLCSWYESYKYALFWSVLNIVLFYFHFLCKVRLTFAD